MRARNIKPGFFKNEDLVEIDPIGRLLFIGLWMMADREGRLEDRPRRIKMEVFPGDNCDVDELLNDLQHWGFIVRYEVDGVRYIQVLNFQKHQNPNPKEVASVIPAPQLSAGNNPDCIQNISGLNPDCIQNISATAESPLLNPESPLLNPESVSSVNGIAVDTVKPSDAVAGATGEAARVLHGHGIGCQPSDPRVRELVRQGVGLDVLDAACREARAKKPGERVPLGYVLKVIESWARDADGMKVRGARQPGKPKSTQEQLAEYHALKAAQERIVDGHVREVVNVAC